MSSLPQFVRMRSKIASSWPGTATSTAPVIERFEFLRQRLDIGPRPFVQPGDRQVRAHRAERLRAAIRDRLVIGDADDKRLLPGQDLV